MWQNNRFVAARDPSRGGLHIIAAPAGFPEATAEEISDNCLELIARDYDHPCSCVYPLSSGNKMVAMAMKVRGSKRESRVHEVVRGVIVEPSEWPEFCRKYLQPDTMKTLFFPEDFDPDQPEAWHPGVVNSEEGKDLLEELNYRQLLALHQAVQEVKQQHLHIHLTVMKGTEKTVFQLVCRMMDLVKTDLFIVADGECTMKTPDILITDQISYQDARSYRKMTMEEFLKLSDTIPKKNEERQTEDKEALDAMLQYAIDYIVRDNVSDYELYSWLGDVQDNEPALYRRFIRNLRTELFRFEGVEYYQESYMKLLYVAFKKSPDVETHPSPDLETAPYDFGEMIHFLKKKSKTKREFRKWITTMLNIQFEAIQLEERVIRDAAWHIA